MTRELNVLTRKATKDTPSTPAATVAKDEESLLNVATASDSSPTAEKTSTVSPSDRRDHRAVIILRKIGSTCIGGEDGGVLRTFEDAVKAMVLATIASLLVIFVGIVLFGAAEKARNQALAMMEDPEMLSYLEESSGFKFITVDEFNVYDEGIANYRSMLLKKQVTLEEKSKELEENKNSIGPLREEVKELENKSGLDKWCGSCGWKGRTSCDARLSYVKDKHQKTDIIGKVEIMKDSSQCKSV